ncbi:MAG TPA: xanthine dehydrogenase [Pseudolabrys sp.]|nr:xanthine dehydrogenase [Pseudolabrys sp.]
MGTNEIASAVAVHLHRARYSVVLSHDPQPPVIRRKMAFHDVLFGEALEVDGVAGERVDNGMQVFNRRSPDGVLVTGLGLLDLLAVRSVDLLVDARMQKRQITPDLRRLARMAVGLGPGFSTAANCDIAIETRPARIGVVVRDGWTDAPDGAASPLGELGSERFVYSTAPGRWHTPVEIGSRVFRGFVLGHLAGAPVRAPRDGILRGIVRDGSEVPAGVKLLEIDPRGRDAQWTGIDQRGHAIAEATLAAIKTFALRSTFQEALSGLK